MKKIFALVLLSSFSTGLSWGAEIFHGKWRGKGTYVLEGRFLNCDQVELAFSGAKDSFRFDGGSRICETMRESFPTVSMDFKDGELLFYGQKVGAVKNNVLESWFSAAEPNGRVRHWRMSMRREGKHLVYEESRTMDNESTPMISFSGILVLED